MQRLILFLSIVLGFSALLLYLSAHHAVNSLSESDDLESMNPPTDIVSSIQERLPYQMQSEVDFKDKALIVNLWATWCGPCLKEIPDLNQLVQEANSEKVLFIAYSDEDPEVYQELLESNPRFKFEYRLVFDHLPLGDYLKSLDTKNKGQSIPVHLLINPNGSLEKVLLGNKKSNLKQIKTFVEQYR